MTPGLRPSRGPRHERIHARDGNGRGHAEERRIAARRAHRGHGGPDRSVMVEKKRGLDRQREEIDGQREKDDPRAEGVLDLAEGRRRGRLLRTARSVRPSDRHPRVTAARGIRRSGPNEVNFGYGQIPVGYVRSCPLRYLPRTFRVPSYPTMHALGSEEP